MRLVVTMCRRAIRLSQMDQLTRTGGPKGSSKMNDSGQIWYVTYLIQLADIDTVRSIEMTMIGPLSERSSLIVIIILRSILGRLNSLILVPLGSLGGKLYESKKSEKQLVRSLIYSSSASRVAASRRRLTCLPLPGLPLDDEGSAAVETPDPAVEPGPAEPTPVPTRL